MALIRPPSFFPGRINLYVPGSQYSADVTETGTMRVPISTGANAGYVAMTGVSVVAAGSNRFTPLVVPDTYGRRLQVVLTASSSGTVLLYGYDYLGQPMTELITFAASASMNTNKTFNAIYGADWSAMGGSTTMIVRSAGAGTGLPYKTVKVLMEEQDGVPIATLGTFTVPDLSTATSTTGDTRGNYLSVGGFAAAHSYVLTLIVSADVDANNNGGLYGMPQA